MVEKSDEITIGWRIWREVLAWFLRSRLIEYLSTLRIFAASLSARFSEMNACTIQGEYVWRNRNLAEKMVQSSRFIDNS